VPYVWASHPFPIDNTIGSPTIFDGDAAAFSHAIPSPVAGNGIDDITPAFCIGGPVGCRSGIYALPLPAESAGWRPFSVSPVLMS